MLDHAPISLNVRLQPEHTLSSLTSHTPMHGVSIAGAGGGAWLLLPKAILMLYIAPLEKFEETSLHACARH